MSEVINGIFSNHCYNQMWELFKTPEDEVGSEVPKERWAGKSPTNCIIYVSRVLIYGHTKIGRSDRNSEIKRLGIDLQDGSKLANFLVKEIGWKAHYWNPDVRNPRDKKSEHPVSYRQVLETKCYLPRSSNLPIDGLIVDYNKTDKKLVKKTVWLPIPVPTLPVNVPIPHTVTVSDDNTEILKKCPKSNLLLDLLVVEHTHFCFHTERYLKFTGIRKDQNYMVK